MQHTMINPIKVEFGLGGTISEVGRVSDQEKIYRKMDGYLVATNVNDPYECCYTLGGKGSKGFGGRIITFNMEDGTKLEVEGPFKINPAEFSCLSFSQRIIALKREVNGSKDTYEDILLYDETPQRGLIRAESVAQQFSDYLGVTVYYSHMGHGFRTSGAIVKEESNG